MTDILKTHEYTFLKLRISELEDKVKNMDKELDEVTACLMQEQLWREETLQYVILYKKNLQTLMEAIKHFAGRPTKDGASKLLDIVSDLENTK